MGPTDTDDINMLRLQLFISVSCYFQRRSAGPQSEMAVQVQVRVQDDCQRKHGRTGTLRVQSVG